MLGGRERPGQGRIIGLQNFQQFEPGGIHTPGAGSGQGRAFQGREGMPLSAAAREELKIHYGGAPIVTIRLVNGVQQDIPHLHIDSRGGQTRWWVVRESIEIWQQRVQTAKQSGDPRYKDIDTARLPSSICHTYPNVPADVLERQPEHRDREWITLSYSLTPTEEEGRVTLAHNQEGKVIAEEYTFLNTPAASADEPTIFRRSVRLTIAPSEFLDETRPPRQAEPKAKPTDEEEQL
jgi:hypothetical protein